MNNDYLHAEGICRKYGAVTVLKEVTFSLRQGEILGLFGPNGSGKSTLLDIIALAAMPNYGRISIGGVDTRANVNSVRPFIGYVPQEIALFEELTVGENLLCWSRLPGKHAKARVHEIAEKLNILSLYKKKVSTLSGGMKRRVNLAVALLGNPALLVLDEPFAGVDADNIEGMEDMLKNMASCGVTQIISGHSPDVMLTLIDRVMVLSRGELAFLGDKGTFMQYAGGGNADQALKNILHGAPL